MYLIAKGYYVVTPRGVLQVHDVSVCTHNRISVHYINGGIQAYKLTPKGLVLLDHKRGNWVVSKDVFWLGRYTVLATFVREDQAQQFYKELQK